MRRNHHTTCINDGICSGDVLQSSLTLSKRAITKHVCSHHRSRPSTLHSLLGLGFRCGLPHEHLEGVLAVVVADGDIAEALAHEGDAALVVVEALQSLDGKGFVCLLLIVWTYDPVELFERGFK